MIVSKLFPELERLPTRKARRQAMYVAKTEVSMRWRFWAAILGIVALSVVLQFSLPRLGIPMTWRGPVRGLVVVVTVVSYSALVLSFNIRKNISSLVRCSGS